MNRFKYAIHGCFTLLKKDANYLYHLIISIIVLIVATYLNLSSLQWLMLVLAIFLVLITEAINTAIEYVVDLITSEYHPFAKHAKDIGAFSVLLASIFAVIVGLVIFLPKIIKLGELYGIYK
ncbi:diacylglycerol kinase family protein [Staphylococcus canis]|uniref:Diacylglycerol kinase family protein n=1 Tax=Staphylococcus canis TaxID=2724942 RepID=A0ABS0TAH7_9STAP|nr:diacylglycerol kinase family protein [Staphylococcus canis]MBI5975749.1 diacylglycerol kinase family protein [Staphylococcus canis]